jgi:hypothetical protein
MMGWITHRMRQRDERGAALVLVLIIITVISLALSALLSMSDTSVRATVQLRDQAASTYQADGAMQAAINNIRKRNYSNAPGQDCFGNPNGTLYLDSFDDNSTPSVDDDFSASVICEPDPHQVLIHCPSLSNCNRPGSAILTLGRIAGEDGINVKALNSPARLLVHGSVFSNSNINVSNHALETAGCPPPADRQCLQVEPALLGRYLGGTEAYVGKEGFNILGLPSKGAGRWNWTRNKR